MKLGILMFSGMEISKKAFNTPLELQKCLILPIRNENYKKNLALMTKNTKKLMGDFNLFDRSHQKDFWHVDSGHSKLYFHQVSTWCLPSVQRKFALN